MAESLVSAVREKVASIIFQKTEEGIRLVLGVDEVVKKLHSNFMAIQGVLEDAEHRQVKEKTVRVWLEKLKDVSYDIDDLLDEWNTAIHKLRMKEVENASKPLRKICSLFPCYSFCCRRVVVHCDIAFKINNLNARLDVISVEKDRFNFSLITKGTAALERPITTSVIDVTKVHGRDEHNKRIVDLLLCGSSGKTISIPMISIVGMGGIGKTTLARLVFNDEKVHARFDNRIWVCVSDPVDEIRIAKAILESLQDVKPDVVELENFLKQIQKSIEGKKFLLALDDVWDGNPTKWEQLMCSLKFGSLESRILVTTCKEDVAKIMGTITPNMVSLEKLSNDDRWSLFSQIAFFERKREECETLKEIGWKIVGKCDGLPLAVKTLGSLLSLKPTKEQWENVLDSELWQQEMEKGIFSLLFSYYDLPSKLRNCFLYCAIFPKGYEKDKDYLIKSWMAQGYLKMEGREDTELIIGEEHFENLAMRSFFQDFERSEDDGGIISCKMHDIVHDFAQYLAKNECSTLSKFTLSDAKYISEASTLKSLKNLKYLRGSLTLTRLGNVTDVGDIKNAQLRSMNKIVCLNLEISKIRAGESMNKYDEVLEALQPSPNLEKLRIRDYEGNILFPSWLISLTKLRVLTLSNSFNCKQLPRLRGLPSLESLVLQSLLGVKQVGNEFLGIESDYRALSSPVIAFPKLKYLKFAFMLTWEDWDYKIFEKKKKILKSCHVSTSWKLASVRH